MYLEFPTATHTNTELLWARYTVGKFCQQHAYGYSEQYGTANEYQVLFDCEQAYTMFTLMWDPAVLGIDFILVP